MRAAKGQKAAVLLLLPIDFDKKQGRIDCADFLG